jgi:hypothetical protein
LLKSCPSCHRLFAAEEVAKAMVASDDDSTPGGANASFKYARPEDCQSPHVHTQVTYRCRFCQHEWGNLTQSKA